MNSGPAEAGRWQLMALNGQCCYGLNLNGQCIMSNASCMSTFANRGWSVCCSVGWFYSPSSSQCIELCDGGKVLFNSVCIQANLALDLSAQNGKPTPTNLFSTCNGLIMPEHFPVCCPPSFYAKDNKGCQYCSGKIFTLVGYQICCNSTSYFDVLNRICLPCQGTIDSSGQLCCPLNNYIAYDTNGIASCVNTCNLDNLYLNRHCCQSMTQQCNSVLTPTFCNPSYFNSFAC